MLRHFLDVLRQIFTNYVRWRCLFYWKLLKIISLFSAKIMVSFSMLYLGFNALFLTCYVIFLTYYVRFLPTTSDEDTCFHWKLLKVTSLFSAKIMVSFSMLYFGFNALFLTCYVIFLTYYVRFSLTTSDEDTCFHWKLLNVTSLFSAKIMV